MDLFIVNRHLDDLVHDEIQDEEDQLKALSERIEKNRKKEERRQARNLKHKERVKSYKQNRHDLMNNRRAAKELKYIPVPEDDNKFIDKNIDELAELLDTTGQEINENELVKIKKRRTNDDDIEGFTILGSDNKKRNRQVKRVLPEWLKKPQIISTDLQNLQTKVSSMKALNKHLRCKLKENGFKHFFPVQAEVIPYLMKSIKLRHCMAPTDICVSAPTGSGKTLTFVLPIIQALEDTVVKQIRALIILPSQDLATQIFKIFLKYMEGTKLDVALITGNTNFIEEQKRLVTKNIAFGFLSNIDILVCTAGRLVDHIKQTPGFTLDHLQFLVIDEADRVLIGAQNDWLYHLERHIYRNEPKDSNGLNVSNYCSRRAPQKLLFSATLSLDPEKLHKLDLFQPILFTTVTKNVRIEDDENISERFMGKYTTPKELTEKFIVSSIELKPLVLYEFIKNEKLTKTLVFTHSVTGAHRLKVLLQSLFNEEVKVEEISSQLTRELRIKLIRKFTDGDIDILICTDSMTRGIDLPNVRCVISYNLPRVINTYIHRSGRTARAGEQGLSVTMLQPNELQKFRLMMMRCQESNLEEIHIDDEQLEQFSEQYTKALEALKATVQGEHVEKKKKVTSVKRHIFKQ